MVKQDRSLGMLILFTILTCGIYPLYFWYKVAEDANTICYGDGDHTTDGEAFILLFLFTCGIYPYYWHYKLGNRLQNNSRRYSLDFTESGATVLAWMLLGMFIGIGPFIAAHILIKNMNNLARAYNLRNSSGAAPGGYGQNYNTPNGPQNYNAPNSPQMNPNIQGGYAQPMGQNYANVGAAVTLMCRSGEFSGASFPVRVNEKIVMGRDVGCNIKFKSDTPKVSRKHCVFEFDGTTMWLTDNTSSYGTYLSDGTKLAPMQRVALQPGMGFYLGSPNIAFYV